MTRSFQSTADLMTVVSDKISRAFIRPLATQAVVIDISKIFDRFFVLICSMKFLSPEVGLYLCKSSIHSCREHCCQAQGIIQTKIEVDI